MWGVPHKERAAAFTGTGQEMIIQVRNEMVSELVAATSHPGGRTRPRNRKAHIVDAAIVLFHRDGYHGVGMEDIASAVGITAGALYRHFRSKQDLLAEALLTVIDEFVALASAAAPDGLEAVVRSLAHRAIDRRDRGPLWQQHARDVSPRQRAVVRRRVRALVGRVSRPLRAARPELSQADADLLTWAVLSVVGSPFQHGFVLGRPRLEDLLCGLAEAVWATKRLPAPRRPGPAPVRAAGVGLTPTSRREVLLMTAGRLFREHGFDAVTMESIGAAAGISGPSIYNHFASKAELLAAVLERGREALQFALAQALAGAETPEQALEPVVRSYVAAALRPDGIPGLLFSETHHLPEERRRAGQRVQRDYVDEWARLLPVGQAQGRIVVHAALVLVNGLVLIPHLRERPDFQDEIVDLALEVLRSAAATS
jgi:AcrR family transcriptional regulator